MPREEVFCGAYTDLSGCVVSKVTPWRVWHTEMNRDNQMFFISNIPLQERKPHGSQVPNWTRHLKTSKGFNFNWKLQGTGETVQKKPNQPKTGSGKNTAGLIMQLCFLFCILPPSYFFSFLTHWTHFTFLSVYSTALSRDIVITQWEFS